MKRCAIIFVLTFVSITCHAADPSPSYHITLPETVVSGTRKKVLHLLGYVREYSSLTTNSDTVFLFREKLVDFVVAGKSTRFQGWMTPRIMASKSYYRFTDSDGLDSVSDNYARHFSWSDMVGPAKEMRLPRVIADTETATDTVRAKYGVSRIWTRDGDRVTLSADILADSANRKMFPLLGRFVEDENLDFRRMNVDFTFDNVDLGVAAPENLTSMSFTIESKGRGDDRLSVFGSGPTAYAETYAEMYIIDREYISVKEASQWRKQVIDWDDVAWYVKDLIPRHDEATDRLIVRVDTIDRDGIRVGTQPDRRLISPHLESGKNNFKILNRLKFMAKTLLPFL